MITEIFTVSDACLISLSASVAGGCVPCAGFYIDRARTAGVSGAEVLAAIDLGEASRHAATADIVNRVRERAGIDSDDRTRRRLEPDPARQGDVSPRELLQLLAAAYAASDHALLTRMLTRARERQVPADQVAEAIQIARGVRNRASAIVDRAAEREAGVPPDREAPPSCVCG